MQLLDNVPPEHWKYPTRHTVIKSLRRPDTTLKIGVLDNDLKSRYLQAIHSLPSEPEKLFTFEAVCVLFKMDSDRRLLMNTTR